MDAEPTDAWPGEAPSVEWRSWTGLGLLAAITVGGLVLPARSLLEAEGPFTLTTLVEGVLPGVIAIGLGALGVALRRRDTVANPFRTALWSLCGALFFGLLAAFVLAHQLHTGASVARPALVINNTGLGGALVGGLVGWYDAERRAEQRRSEGLGRRLAFLNRMLRHDVRNDAGIIVGNAELLQDEVEDDESLTFILDAAEHIVELTHVAHAFEQVEEGAELEAIGLGSTLDRCLKTARSSFPDATIIADIDAAHGVDVHADRLLTSVFENLIRNAVQHNDKDEPTVEVRARVDEETAQVEVADDGPGIDPAIVDEIFEEGSKGDSSGGTGLGMHLVDTLVTRYGGSVDVEAREPRGTVFRVHLPRHEAGEAT